MTLPPPARKLVLIAHITTSVGWLGAVAAYLVLDVIASTGNDVETMRAAYTAMGLIVTFAIVPLALAAVLIGVVNALGTPWGLIRHYWVLVKLILTTVAAGILLIEAPTVRGFARAVATGTDPRELPGSLPHSIGGLAVLLSVTILSVAKPKGLTPYGWRKRVSQPGKESAARSSVRGS